MITVPFDTPHITPLELPIVATAGLLLLHVPPVLVLVSVVQSPLHTLSEPPIAAGSVFTVTTAVAEHPETVYETVHVPAPEPP